jgi:hypothetical protein
MNLQDRLRLIKTALSPRVKVTRVGEHDESDEVVELLAARVVRAALSIIKCKRAGGSIHEYAEALREMDEAATALDDAHRRRAMFRSCFGTKAAAYLKGDKEWRSIATTLEADRTRQFKWWDYDYT